MINLRQFVDVKTGESVGRNESGELCVRGPQNMKGYLNNEKATKDMIDEDGWLHTGMSKIKFVVFIFFVWFGNYFVFT